MDEVEKGETKGEQREQRERERERKQGEQRERAENNKKEMVHTYYFQCACGFTTDEHPKWKEHKPLNCKIVKFGRH
eukprot:6195027-Pleurochrysis_carterae.AAC.1